MTEQNTAPGGDAPGIERRSTEPATGDAPGSRTRRRGDDETLATHRAADRTIKEAAEAAGLSERQARRRLHEPDVAARVAELRSDRRAENLERLERLVPKAVKRLNKLLDSENPTAQLGAIRLLFSVEPQLYEQVELEPRLRKIEKQAAQERQTAARGPADGWPNDQ